ncbi:hypothetical protein BCR34DRAFT_586557 [Clohesyomyces aquaticus]|uniref:SET domain-containing protein n=1 Tax=Clohesyomyces aquaticus TaxID=1231657 RepID=A0A1Y1ZT62_9PLEO|nr:hypothetical protein BCR34DRAFT_586557 [Clohesyomyces aquaticus]
MAALYTVLPSPGKGLGCFSINSIPIGTRILSETPLFAIDEPRANSSVIDAFSHLSSSDQALYLTLHASDPTSRGPALVVDIFNSNAWQTESRTSILLLAARFNHSCIPNASFAWNARLMQITVHAIATIPANEQINLSYETPYQTLASRREKLSAYGFQCSCKACSDDSIASDVRRARMAVLDGRIRVERKQKWKSEAPKASLQLIRLVKEEGLVGEALGLAFHDAAAGWKKHGRLDLAVRYALKELEICVTCYGMDSPYVETTGRFLKNLQAELAASQENG